MIEQVIYLILLKALIILPALDSPLQSLTKLTLQLRQPSSSSPAETLGLRPVLGVLEELVTTSRHLGPRTVTELHHEVVDQEEDPRPGQAREDDGEEEGGDDAPLGVAASLDLHQVGTLDPVLLLLLPAAGRAWLLLYIAANRNIATPLTATLSYF